MADEYDELEDDTVIPTAGEMNPESLWQDDNWEPVPAYAQLNFSGVDIRGEGDDSNDDSAENSVSATLTASWEPDLWGEVRRGIESSQATAQQSDALLAGVRLSISSSVASNYLALRQMDIDVRLLQQQQTINQQLLDMIQAQFTQGVATNDQLLVAQDQLTTSIAAPPPGSTQCLGAPGPTGPAPNWVRAAPGCPAGRSNVSHSRGRCTACPR